METRGFALERREQTDDGKLRVSGRAVVYDSLSEDLGGFRERFVKGALERTLSEQRDVGLLYSHDSAAVLASTGAGNLRLVDDDDGLGVEATLDMADPDVQRLSAKLDAGTVKSMSFGFRAVRDKWDDKDERGVPVRTVTEAQLIETSAVWLPAYTATSIEGRAGLADLPVGALATMPAELRDQMVAELREGRPLAAATRKTVERAIASLEQLRSRPHDEVRRRVEMREVELRGRNAGQWLESMLHRDFTDAADYLASEGHLTRAERITLSSAIGDALTAFVARIDADAPQLYQRDPFDFPPQDDSSGADDAMDERVHLSAARRRLALFEATA